MESKGEKPKLGINWKTVLIALGIFLFTALILPIAYLAPILAPMFGLEQVSFLVHLLILYPLFIILFISLIYLGIYREILRAVERRPDREPTQFLKSTITHLWKSAICLLALILIAEWVFVIPELTRHAEHEIISYYLSEDIKFAFEVFQVPLVIGIITLILFVGTIVEISIFSLKGKQKLKPSQKI